MDAPLRNTLNRRQASQQAAVLAVAVALTTSTALAIEVTGAVTGCHDPSLIMKDELGYWTYSTAPNLNVRRSTDLMTWTWQPRAFNYPSGVPPWMNQILTTLEGGSGPWNLWAPEITVIDDVYHLYYSRNMGSDSSVENSGLGLATSTSLAGPWEDQGMVLLTDLFADSYRAIDPALTFDQEGRLWLSAGSFGSPNTAGYNNGGIRIWELDPETGKLLDPDDDGVRIAASWIEAPFIHYNEGHYYLFFNQGQCCAGRNSRYYLRIGRSASITGPYTDMRGRSLLNPTHGGSLFLGRDEAANYQGNNPRANFGSVGREIGPGHVSILAGEDGFDRYSYHYYDGNTGNGEPTLGIRTMVWTETGWPRTGYDLPATGVYAIYSITGDAADTAEGSRYLDLQDQTGTVPVTREWDGSQSQVWHIERTGVNQFRLRSSRTDQFLTSTSAGELFMAAGSASQLQRWLPEQTSDRSFRFINRSTGHALSLSDQAVTVATWDHDESQRWWVVPTGIYWLRNDHGGLAAGIPNSEAGTQLDQFNYFESPLQQWRFLPLKGGYARIESVGSALSLGISGTPSIHGAAVRQITYTGALAHQWSIEPLSDGSHRLINRASHFVMQMASNEPLALATQNEWLHIRNQQWSPQLIDVSPLAIPPEPTDPDACDQLSVY